MVLASKTTSFQLRHEELRNRPVFLVLMPGIGHYDLDSRRLQLLSQLHAVHGRMRRVTFFLANFWRLLLVRIIEIDRRIISRYQLDRRILLDPGKHTFTVSDEQVKL